jgi:hypothetical protein
MRTSRRAQRVDVAAPLIARPLSFVFVPHLRNCRSQGLGTIATFMASMDFSGRDEGRAVFSAPIILTDTETHF